MRFSRSLLLLLMLPGPLGAQAESVEPGPMRARATASAILKASELAEKQRVFLGGWVGIVLGERVAVGGGGLVPLEAVELPGSEAGSGFELRTGYGGLFLRMWEPLSTRVLAEGGLLLGAGNGKVWDRLQNREQGSDNFVVLEPELGISIPLFGRFRAGATSGYRFVWGVEDLPLVVEEDLRAWTLSLFLSLGGR